MRYPNVAGRLFNLPLLLDQRKGEVIVKGLASRLGVRELVSGAAAVEGDLAPPEKAAMGRGAVDRWRPYAFDAETGLALIEIDGVLVHRFGYVGALSGLVGYDGISTQIRVALDDPDVRGILLDIHSPGGEVSGCFALCREIRAARASKPVWAIANELATSAAYAIAAQADYLFLPASAEVGSIGVVLMHADYSRALDADGIKVSLIFAGERKVDGNPYEPLPAPVRARWEGELEALRGQFAAEVGAGRPGLGAAAAIETEAAILMGADAVAARLADGVADPPEVVAAFAEELAARDEAGAGATSARRIASP